MIVDYNSHSCTIYSFHSLKATPKKETSDFHKSTPMKTQVLSRTWCATRHASRPWSLRYRNCARNWRRWENCRSLGSCYWNDVKYRYEVQSPTINNHRLLKKLHHSIWWLRLYRCGADCAKRCEENEEMCNKRLGGVGEGRWKDGLANFQKTARISLWGMMLFGIVSFAANQW